MANVWRPEEEDIVIEGKKQQFRNMEISDILNETFGDKWRTYSETKIRLHWQHMYKKNPELKKLSVARGRKKGSIFARWSPEEDELLKELHAQNESLEDIAQIMGEAFPGKRNWVITTITNRITVLDIGERVDITNRPRLTDDMEGLQDRCHPSMKIIEFVNSHKILLECMDCGATANRMSSSLGGKCNICKNSPDTPQDLYLLEFSDFDYPSVKIGISRDYFGLRSKQFPEHKQVLVYNTIFKNAKGVEEKIKEEFEKYKTNPHELFENGHSECFDISMKEKIKNRVEELING